MYLNCHSYHSLRYGTLPLETLVQQALACGVTSLALTDINTVTGIYDFVKICRKVGIKPVVGMEFREGNRLRYIGLAKTQRGIGELCRLLTARNCEGIPLPDRAPDFQDVITIYPLSNVPQQLGTDEYIGIRPSELNLLVQEKWKRL
ncbi:PHP domain-containing protein [Sphingobacterium arenae]|uniref:PHP domain-containing protein n=1 Tax=Sphingobacterium arenae TaxID=1280598 RepID=A0ABR7Y319_9SPHI|nr:PHP domain-containing protein [Sphingobacterium arenae]MBD1425691.1 PHP domain-containing protein [Sphingobacterium arenae]